ncbi:MAG: YhfC family intramembrane metalloprotease [Candidatus Aenigmarchaeota archaeon]|nr:YhfC family intramembrane metalloprotease [Candidatus Aenigmarchaeota archaeon]
MADVINPFLMLAGIGMMAVAIVAVTYWKRKTNVPWKWFGYGALVWVAAIAVKVVMDFTMTPPLQSGMFSLYGMAAAFAAMSFYVGLRTGFLESGFSYLFARKKARKAKITFNEAIAFGIGFGAIEAFLLGLSSFLSILVLFLYPQILDQLDVVTKDMVLSSLSQETLIVVPAIVERIAAIFIHTFAAVLVIASANTKRMKYVWGSVVYKSVTDGMIPLLTALAGMGILSSYTIEIPVIVLAVIGYFGILDVKGRFK